MSVTAIMSALEGRFRGRLERDVSLSGFTTYQLGGPASLYAEPSGQGDLEALAEALRVVATSSPLPVLSLGRGSNVVISDEGFPGVVIRLGSNFAWIKRGDDLEVEGGRRATMQAGAFTPLPQLANWALRRGLSGIEFAVAIPGSVGGAIRMNAGAHGRETSDCLMQARVFDVDSLELRVQPAPSLGFSYRRSNLVDAHLVVDARFWLTPQAVGAVKETTRSYRLERARTQPGAAHNAGSVFKNPPGEHAGRLVEAAGLKGFAVRRAAVSELHANFFVASDGATAQDVYELVQAVRARVMERFGVELEPEIRFVGAFEPRDVEVGGGMNG